MSSTTAMERRLFIKITVSRFIAIPITLAHTRMIPNSELTCLGFMSRFGIPANRQNAIITNKHVYAIKAYFTILFFFTARLVEHNTFYFPSSLEPYLFYSLGQKISKNE